MQQVGPYAFVVCRLLPLLQIMAYIHDAAYLSWNVQNGTYVLHNIGVVKDETTVQPYRKRRRILYSLMMHLKCKHQAPDDSKLKMYSLKHVGLLIL